MVNIKGPAANGAQQTLSKSSTTEYDQTSRKSTLVDICMALAYCIDLLVLLAMVAAYLESRP